MIALLGSALGFGTSFLPQVLGFFQKKQDHKNRIEELKMQGELASLGVMHDIEKLDKKAEIAETKALYDFANPRSWLCRRIIRKLYDLLLLTCFLAYSLPSKRSSLLKALEAGSDWKDAVPLMFDTETQALFSAIIAFWFGQRSVSKFMGANK